MIKHESKLSLYVCKLWKARFPTVFPLSQRACKFEVFTCVFRKFKLRQGQVLANHKWMLFFTQGSLRAWGFWWDAANSSASVNIFGREFEPWGTNLSHEMTWAHNTLRETEISQGHIYGKHILALACQHCLKDTLFSRDRFSIRCQLKTFSGIYKFKHHDLKVLFSTLIRCQLSIHQGSFSPLPFLGDDVLGKSPTWTWKTASNNNL